MIRSNTDPFYSSANLIHSPGRRVAWVDYAKGICIIMVVTVHATFDYGAAVGSEGWLHHVVAFANPFLMPGFFLLAGLFLSLSINGPFRDFIDRKVLYFFYVYLIWSLIQLILNESGMLLNNPAGFMSAYFHGWIEPGATLWFVHMLAIFYLVTRLLRGVPLFAVFVVAAGFQIASQLGWISTGWSVIDRFFGHYAFFFVGYAAAPWIFSFARQMPSWRYHALAWLALWAVANAVFVVRGLADAPGVGLLLGLIGAVAIVTSGSLLAGFRWAEGLRYCGANFIVIYLSFFLPMKIASKILAGSGIIPDVGWAGLLITGIAVVTPLILYWLVKDTWMVFLYKRPAAFRLGAREGHAARL